VASRRELIEIARRALRHSRDNTTDSAPDTLEISVGDYRDADIWNLELREVFRRVPIALALTAELPELGDYKAMEASGLPVLLTRGTDGVVRAFLNVCRHRGARVCEPGTANARRFQCPYHAWTYNDRGQLAGIYRADQFGAVDRGDRGLVALPAAERFGFVWVVLSPDGDLQLDPWLGSFAAELESLGLDQWTVFAQDELPGPNWKLVFDGYLEGYHGDSLHADSLAADSIANLLVVDAYGPHQRLVFSLKSLLSIDDQPEETWEPTPHLVPNHILFPNVSIAGSWHDLCMVCLVLPGRSVGTSVTIQTVLTRRRASTKREHALARNFRGLMLTVARDEDYPAVQALQEGLGSGANEHFIIGRNEIAVQHFHQQLRQLVGGAVTGG